jgi:hypothetical protein
VLSATKWAYSLFPPDVLQKHVPQEVRSHKESWYWLERKKQDQPATKGSLIDETAAILREE